MCKKILKSIFKSQHAFSLILMKILCMNGFQSFTYQKNMSFSFLQLLYSTFRLFKFLIRKCRQEEEMKVIQIGKEAVKLCCYIICICILFIKWLLVLIICVTLQDRTSASKINDLSRYDMNKSMSYA